MNEHVYLSTACFHDDHAYCGCRTRQDGAEKEPAKCKFCNARCMQVRTAALEQDPSGRMKRIWRYGYRDWQPRWWNYLLPYFGGDEYGRRTIVQHVPPFGFAVVALPADGHPVPDTEESA